MSSLNFDYGRMLVNWELFASLYRWTEKRNPLIIVLVRLIDSKQALTRADIFDSQLFDNSSQRKVQWWGPSVRIGSIPGTLPAKNR